MTVIIGINLSDRIYLAGDTRLSYIENDQLYIRHDNMQKVERLPISANIAVACAGSADFAKFIINRLSKSAIVGSIRQLRNEIDEWIRPVVDEYFSNNKLSYITLMFAGSDSSSKKIINGQQLIDMSNAFTGGQGVLRLNPALQSVVTNGKPIPQSDLELNVDDTQLFSVIITENSLKIIDTKWGEFLVYGPEGMHKDDISIKDIAGFEFEPSIQNNGSGMGNDLAMLNAFIFTQAEKYNLSTVGGSVLAMSVLHNGESRSISGMVYMYPLADINTALPHQQVNPTIINKIDVIDDSHIYREVDGTRYRLIPVSRYQAQNENKMLLTIL